jgi:hypothetical protein
VVALMIVETEFQSAIIDFSLGCTAEDHITDCTVDVVAVAQTSCSNDVESWCQAAHGFWEYSILVGDQCFDCERLVSECWIVNIVDG